MNNPTIREVARLANVSVSTVSRVINDMPDVSKASKERVWEVIRECGYVPNANARNLKQLSSKVILIIVKGTLNPFFTPIVEIMQAEIEKTKFTPLVHYINEGDDEVDSAIHLIAEKKAVGIIFVGGSPTEKELMLAKIKIPCILSTMSAEGLNLKNVSSICIDDKESAKKSAHYLLEMGHHKIAILGGRLLSRDLILKRYEGVVECLREHGYTFDDRLYIPSRFSYQHAYEAVSQVLDAGKPEFTALLAMADTMAIGAARAIFDHGLSVPDDISIIGFDGIELSRYYNPTIATIRQPSEEIAQKSVYQLIKQIEIKSKAKNIVLETELIPGESVKHIINAG